MNSEFPDKYSISDLATLSGIKAHTIRIWEKRYGVIAPGRTDTNIRYYSNDDLRKLLNISLLNQNGFKISDISKLSNAELTDKVTSVTAMRTDSSQEQLLLSLLEMDEPLFHRVFERLVADSGFEEAMVSVIFPFFTRIGIMWQAGTINPAQEHFFSNLIRAKIISATGLLTSPPADDVPTVLLFLPESELHEIGLLFYNYAFRKRGYPTIYLGQSVPYESLGRIYSITSPSIIITSITNPVIGESLVELYAKVCSQAEPAVVYFTGPVPEQAVTELPANAFFTADLRKLLGL